MKFRHVLLRLLCSTAFVLYAQAALADTAGHVQFVNGDVRVINPNGNTDALQKGEAINEGDTISSAKEASAQVKMEDGGFIAVRQDTQLKFDSFKVALKQGDPENSFFSLVKGSFRAVTGLIGRVNRQHYKITTPVATIGIRGTDHETAFVPNALPGVPAGAYSKVNIGETSLTTNVGSINIKPNQMGYASGMTHIPELLPINTSLFSVGAAPAKEPKVIGAKDKEEKDGGGTGGGEPIRDTAVVDNSSKSGTANSNAPATAAIVTTANTTISTVSAPPQTTIPVTLTDNSNPGLVLDTTNQTVSTGGSSVSVQSGGTFGIDAQTAADEALAAANAAKAVAAAAATVNTQVAALTVVDTTPGTSAIAAANSTITTATSSVASATALTPANATTATSNATSAQVAATAAASKASAALAALTANGAFADSLAGPANTATASANTTLQTANSSIQVAAGTVTAQNTALTAATAASAALAAANTSQTAANNSLNTANTNNAGITSAQSAASGLASQATTAASLATAAANAALAAAAQAATLQAAGDFTGAAAQLAIAQQQQAIAQQQLSIAQNASTTLSSQLAAATTTQTDASNAVTAAVSSANAAAANAGSGATGAQSNAVAAQTAATNAGAALATISSLLPTITSNAALVAANAPIAAYYNPKVAGGSFIGQTSMSAPVTGGFNAAFTPSATLQANTSYVFDGSGNLVEMRNAPFQVQTNQNGLVLTTPAPMTGTAGADIKWSGGTGADAFNLSDNSVNIGRWIGATVTVTDNANPANVYTATPADSLWAVVLPPPTGYVQTLTGTTSYTMAGHTTPVDAFGNLGVLNSATLSADFTHQLVSAAVNLTMGAGSMAGTFNVAAINMPIEPLSAVNPSGFGGTPTVTCSGACAAGATGYSGDMGGSFAGNAAASAGMSYNIWPSTMVSLPSTNAVQGLVAFTTTTPPTALSGGPFSAYAGGNIALEYQTLFFNNSGLVLPPASAVLPTANPATSGTQAVTITQTPSSDNGFFGFTDTFTVTNPVAVTPLPSGIQFGANTFTAFSQSSSLALGPNNDNQLQWIVGPEGYLDSVGAAAIAASTPISPVILSYRLDGGIAPASNNKLGITVTGTLDSATLSADLTNLTATASLGITMNSTAYSMVGSNMPIFFGKGSSTIKNQFGGDAVVTGGTCAGLTCGGFIDGAFTGQNYAGALLSYNMHDDNANLNPNGVAALVVNTPFATGGTAAPTGNSFVGITNGFGNKQGSSGSGIQQVSSSSLTTNASGALTGFGGSSFTSTISCISCTGTTAPSNATTGISFGTWDQGTFANSFSGTSPPTSPPLNLFWITGAEATPVYLAQVLTGTVAYNFAGGAFGDMLGNSGTITSASLAADFTHQTMAINLQGGAIGTAASGWSASTPNALIGANCGSSNACFSANSFGPSTQPGYLTVVLDGNSSTSNPSVNGQVSGQLVGNSLNGAILSFSMNGPTGTALAPTGFENIQGVAGFTSATANDPLTPYKLVVAMLNDPLVTNDGDLMIGGYQAPANVAFDGTGNLIKLNDNNKSATTIALSAGTPGSAFSGASTAAGTACSPCTDTVTGIQWGRWAPGVTATVTETGASPKAITINGGGMHWIASPTLTGPVTLPVGGSYTYIVSGGTNPTDSSGAVGSLTSASLSANFSAQTVNVGVNVTVGSTSITSSATGVPIQQKATFEVNTASGLAVSCAATACPTAQGEIRGGFGGAGAIGAVMAYGFLPNPAVANMITGVVALHR